MRIVLTRQNFAEDRNPRGHRKAVGVVCAAVENLVLDDQVHHFPARAKCRQRHAATDGLGQRDHVRLHAEIFAGTAPAKLRAGLHFVEDQQRAVLGRDRAQAFKEAGLRHAKPDVHQDGFKNDRGNLSRKLLEAVFDAAKIVEGGHRDVVENRLDDAEASGNRIRCMNVTGVFELRLHADESRVVQSVIRTFKAQDFVAARCRTRDPARMHGRFRAAVAKPHHLNGIPRANLFRQLQFHAMRHAERGTAVGHQFHRFDHRGMPVAGHQRAEAQVVIDVFVAVDILNLAAVPFRHKNRIWIIRAVIAGYAQRNSFLRFLVRFRRFRRALLVQGDLLLKYVVHLLLHPGRPS